MEESPHDRASSPLTQPSDCASNDSASEPSVLFVVGKSPPKAPSSRLSSSADRQSAHPTTKPKLLKPPRNRHTTSKKKYNVPVPRAVPLAFPAASSFTFSVTNPAANALSLATKEKTPTRAIQVLPTDVLVMVVQAVEPKHHRHLLLSLSLVNQTLNITIAPLLYRSFRLPSLPDVYDFSFGPRYPGCITSLELTLAPSPMRREWSPPDSNWTERFICTLGKLERLMSLSINRCDNDAVPRALTTCSSDPTFLPLLQKVSFGSWHQLSSLSLGRSIASYGVVFNLDDMQACERLERLIVNLKSSRETARELKIVFNMPNRVEISSLDCQRNVLDLIGKHMPGLRVLNVRFQQRNGKVDASINLTNIIKLIPTLSELVSLEFFDSQFPQFNSDQVMKAATALSAAGGACPNLALVNFDGLLWKHTTSAASASSESTLPLTFASLSLENGRVVDQTQSEIAAPILPWTPAPSNKRGRRWWERRVRKLNASSQAQAVSLLWQWMAEHWGKEYMMDVASLERTVTQW
ncbi:hypothetical protein FRC12_025145 [Ceratobasidium sp. 428]|nr:hypothetical protein FRC12_025145 [Ceratobasidium sp. 428]